MARNFSDSLRITFTPFSPAIFLTIERKILGNFWVKRLTSGEGEGSSDKMQLNVTHNENRSHKRMAGTIPMPMIYFLATGRVVYE